MGDAVKLTLSAKELAMVIDTEWILTKQAIIQKVYDLFAACIPKISETVLQPAMDLPAEVLSSVPKIYKGENYLQLPYVMLDYPRYFVGEDIFALRTMFWWGNFFSITLHLSGQYKSAFQQKLAVEENLGTDFYIGVNDDQWAHHFAENNYVKLNSMTFTQRMALIQQKPFLKLALKFKLDHWNRMDVLLQSGYAQISKVLS